MKNEEIHKNFCQNIRHLRKVYLMKQKEMAPILGISVGKLSRIENCDPAARIDCGMICQVCSHFDLSADEILFENWPEILQSRH